MQVAAVTFTSAVNMTPLYIMGGIFALLALCCLLPGWKRPTSLFRITVHLSGRHPYLTETTHDVAPRDVEKIVRARNWNHAEKLALGNLQDFSPFWSAWVVSIARHKATGL